MKVAIIHDWLPYLGGAELVLKSMLEIFPDAILYTSIYNKRRVGDLFKDVQIRTSFIDRLPFAKTKYGMYLSLMPYAFEQFDLRGFDVVISLSTSCAKGVLTDASTLHICYCNTPMRYAWDFYFEYLDKSRNPLRRVLIHYLMHRIRMWDVLVANRVDHFIANSQNVARRITKHYRRDSEVIYPPVNPLMAEAMEPIVKEDYYLVVSRLVAYKRIDLAVEAFNRLHKRLIIVGEGPEKSRLEKMAGPTITFVGRVSDEDRARYYQGCKAFVFPGEEDFGITPVEAQYFGKPVIAYGRGGALETVKRDISGVFFDVQEGTSLMKAVERMEHMVFDSQAIQEHASSFSDPIFKERLLDFIHKKREEFLKK